MRKYAGKSDIGRLRMQNEDAFCIIGGAGAASEGDFPDAPLVFAVADGMGGHLAGDIASQTAIAVIRENLEAAPFDVSDDVKINARLVDLVREANAVIYKKSLEDPECYGMGTTLIIAVISEGALSIAHIGDSCAYRVRDGVMTKITTDHTYVEELVRIGSLTREEAARHPKRNLITKVVGCMSNVAPDLYNADLLAGDKLLICTDGLSKMLPDEDIAGAMASSGDPESICDALITGSNRMGGLDNITVIVYVKE